MALIAEFSAGTLGPMASTREFGLLMGSGSHLTEG
jgi:hypothetical protein